jgi:hypothetical protein
MKTFYDMKPNMKTNMEDNLEQIFDMSGDTQTMVEVIDNHRPDLRMDSSEDDFEYARQNLRTLIESGHQSLETLSHLADVSESTRAFEVLANLLKTLSDANKDLMQLHRTKKALIDEKGPTNVTNALYVGTTADLQKLIKGAVNE